MKALVLNGSPRRGRSGTMMMTEAFLKGLSESGRHEIDVVELYGLDIAPCLGCFRCWTSSPGQCVLKDDMAALLEKVREADALIWSAPLYYYGLPSQAKACMDRMLPLNLPQMLERPDGSCRHPSRYDLSGQRQLLLSSCGYFTLERNYEALCEQFRIVYGDDVQWIRRSQGELLGQPALDFKTKPYLKQLEQAGAEWGRRGRLSEATMAELEAPFFAPAAYLTMANASWDIAAAEASAGVGGEGCATAEGQSSPGPDPALALLRQMSALYNPAALNGKPAVLEMAFTDLDRCYQLQMDRDACQVVADPNAFLPYTTRIETPLGVWRRISAGELGGAQAMMEGSYRTVGDFQLMLALDRLFGMEPPAEKATGEDTGKRTHMIALFLPWLFLWSLSSLNAAWGAGLCLLVCAGMPFCAPLFGGKLTVYDNISSLMAAGLALLQIFFLPMEIVLPLGYLLYGLLWLLSLRGPLPITAYYSAYDYGGEGMFRNPLFLRTNAILTAAWGGVYLLAAALNFLALLADWGVWVRLVIMPLMSIMLGFTYWFQRWYPAAVARRGKSR